MDAEYLGSTVEETPTGARKKRSRSRIHPFSAAGAPRPPTHSNCCITFLVILSYLIFSSIFIAGVVLVMLVAATALFFVPQPNPPYFIVSSSSADVHNITGNLTISNVFVSFMVEGSHNKGIVYYENINVSIFKDKDRISSTMIEPFEQHRHNRTTQIIAVFEEMSVKAEVWIFSGAAEGECGVAHLDCELTVKERYKEEIKLWPAMEDNQKFECKEIKVYFCTSRSLPNNMSLDCNNHRVALPKNSRFIVMGSYGLLVIVFMLAVALAALQWFICSHIP